MKDINSETAQLASRMVAIPSYVDAACDERELTDFLESFFKQYLPQLTVERQVLAGSPRANLIVRGAGQPRLLVVGHVDTVQPKDGWLTDPLKPAVSGGDLYGLGAADMKGSLAAFLTALVSLGKQELNDLAVLLYVDEEYEFKGMKRLLEDKDITGLRPELILSLDGSLEPASGCRGLVELALTIKGRSGHAANPDNGVNAITESLAVIRELQSELAVRQDAYLGQTTCNVAYIRGGVCRKVNGKTVWQQEGNVIADTAELILEVRPATARVTAASVLALLRPLLKSQGLRLAAAKVKHDIAPWPAGYDPRWLDRLTDWYKEAGVPLKMPNLKLNGYVDVQMLAEVIPAPAFIIGAGGVNKHGANECVPLANLNRATELYKSILKGIL